MTDERPAFGQVWQWPDKVTGSRIMLIAPEPGEPGAWYAITIDYPEMDNVMLPWHGLHDDPNDRIDGWERLD